MKLIELTDATTNELVGVNLEVPRLEPVSFGPNGGTVTRSIFKDGDVLRVYERITEIMQLAGMAFVPVVPRGELH
jgi:hypothetical protein